MNIEIYRTKETAWEWIMFFLHDEDRNLWYEFTHGRYKQQWHLWQIRDGGYWLEAGLCPSSWLEFSMMTGYAKSTIEELITPLNIQPITLESNNAHF